MLNFLGSGRTRVEVYRIGSDSGSNLGVGSGAGTKSSTRAGLYLQAKGDELEKLSYTWERLAVDLKGLNGGPEILTRFV